MDRLIASINPLLAVAGSLVEGIILGQVDRGRISATDSVDRRTRIMNAHNGKWFNMAGRHGRSWKNRPEEVAQASIPTI